MKLPRRLSAGATATALVAAGLLVAGIGTAPGASAAPVTLTNSTLTWDINNEVNAGAFAPGTWNLLSAGLIGNPGAGGKTLTTADQGATWSNGTAAGWKNTLGNVTIQDKQADGSYAPTTFQGTRTNSAGTATSGSSLTNLAETRMSFAKGTGTADPVANTASITWDGDVSVLFYSGMTYFTLSDPTLTVEGDGDATLTATAGGYATSMADSTVWTALPNTPVTLASMKNVDITDDGVVATPDYLGVEYAAGANTPQARTGASWGSFPQDFVDFQQLVGQGPYWYSTGGSADPRKPAKPLSVTFRAPAAVPTVTVSKTDFLPSGDQQVTVTGTGFDPTLATGTRPPLAGKPAGTYVAFGKFAPAWRPSAGAASTTRKTSSVQWAVLAADMATVGGAAGGAIELTPAGTFTATLTVNKATIDTAATDPALTNYGIYTYPGSGAAQAAYETYTPVTFTAAPVVTPPVVTPPVVVPPATTPPVAAAPAQASTTTVTVTKKPKATPRKKAGRATFTVTGPTTSGALLVVLTKGKQTRTTKTVAFSGGTATMKLPKLAKGRYQLTATYAGSAVASASSATTGLKVS